MRDRLDDGVGLDGALLALLREYAEVLPAFETLRASLAELTASAEPDDGLGAVLRAFLVRCATAEPPLYAACRLEVDSWLATALVAEAVFDAVAPRKLVLYLSGSGLRPARGAILAHHGSPSAVLYDNTVVIRMAAEALLNGQESVVIGDADLPEFYRNKHALIGSHRPTPDPETAAAMAADEALVCSLFERIREDPANVAPVPDEVSHPYVGPMLHVLPRLVEASPGQPLSAIAAALPRLRALGFETLLIGSVDRQSCAVYYGESIDGCLTGYVNNHGYWSSGEPGADPMLGGDQAYGALQRTAANFGVLMIQDGTFGTLGYPAQVARLGTGGVADPVHCVRVGDTDVDVRDGRIFLHGVCIPDEESLGEGVEPAHYARIISQTHIGSPFALPKLNLFLPDVRERALQRARRQQSDTGVRAFRIDMAKHIGLEALRDIVARLRSSNAGQPLMMLLEYWSVRYRDLRLAMAALGEENRGVYFHDFPLAAAIQSMLLRGADYTRTLDELLAERRRWCVAPDQLIGHVIDHDFSFRPIYNGSAESSAMVVLGHALCAMLGVHGPYVYVGAADRRAGVPDLARYFEYDEFFSRQPTAELWSLHDPDSPAAPIADLLGSLGPWMREPGWRLAEPCVYGDADQVTVVRFVEVAGQVHTIEAWFARDGTLPAPEPDAVPLFVHDRVPATAIWRRPPLMRGG